MMPGCQPNRHGSGISLFREMSTRDQCPKPVLAAQTGAADNAASIFVGACRQYWSLAAAIVVVSLIVLWLGLPMLIVCSWLLGWLRGTTGLLVLAAAAVTGLVAWDVCTYRALPEEAPVATLSFEADGAQRYQVRIEQGGEVRFVTLEGDLWQLDARILRWKGVATL